jgi:biopolymer transport protein ExbD
MRRLRFLSAAFGVAGNQADHAGIDRSLRESSSSVRAGNEESQQSRASGGRNVQGRCALVRYGNMARHKARILPILSEPDLDISSLIDICFLLLIYFLVSMTIVPREQDLGMSLPTIAGNPGQPPISPMIIRIDGQGAVYTGNGLAERQLDTYEDSRDLPLLSSQLVLYRDAARTAGDHPSVRLRVDSNTRQQRVIDVLNALAAVEISSVTFEDLLVL